MLRGSMLAEMFEDAKGLIRILTLEKDRQSNGQTKKNKSTSNGLENTMQKYRDRAT